MLLKIDPFAGVHRTFATTRRAQSDRGSMLFSPSSTPDTPRRSPRLLARQQIWREKSTTTYCPTIQHSASGGTGSHGRTVSTPVRTAIQRRVSAISLEDIVTQVSSKYLRLEARVVSAEADGMLTRYTLMRLGS